MKSDIPSDATQNIEVPLDATLVIFDLDCTLYRRGHLVAFLVLDNLFSLRLLSAERHARETLRGRDFVTSEVFYNEFFRVMASHCHKSAGCCRKWYFEKYLPGMVKILKRRFCLAPWVKGTMEELNARGVKIAVLSDYTFMLEKLLAIGFDPSWATAGLFAAPELGGLKPCREVFLRLLGTVGVEPSPSVYMVGDRQDTDIQGAENAGISGMLVL